MGPTTWRRAVAAVAAVSLVAATVVMAVGDQGRIPVAGTNSAAESIDSTPDAAAPTAATRGRQTHPVNRADHSAAKYRPVLFAAALAAAMLLAAAVAWLRQPALAARPTLHRRRYSLSLRGPPALQLALID